MSDNGAPAAPFDRAIWILIGWIVPRDGPQARIFPGRQALSAVSEILRFLRLVMPGRTLSKRLASASGIDVDQGESPTVLAAVRGSSSKTGDARCQMAG